MLSINNIAIAIFFFCMAGCTNNSMLFSDVVAATTQPVRAKKLMTHHSGETNFVTLIVSMQKSSRLGEPIYADFTLLNGRDIAILLNHSDDARDIWINLISERHADGEWHEPVPRTDFGTKYAGDPYSFERNMPFLLQPNDVLTRRYNLCDYFKITKPGDYALTALRTVDGSENDMVTIGGLSDEVDVGPIRFSVNK